MSNKSYYLIFLKKIVCIFIVNFLIRVAFIFENIDIYRSYLYNNHEENLISLLSIGLLSDLKLILLINSPVFIIYIIFSKYKAINTISTVMFLTVNSFAVFISIADIFYFQHSMKRSSGAILGMIDGFYLMIFDYFKEYWYGLLFFIASIVAISFVSYFPTIHRNTFELKKVTCNILLVFFITYTSFNYGYFSNNIENDLVTNTPLSIIDFLLNEPNFINNKSLPNYDTFKSNEATNNIRLTNNYHTDSIGTNKMNVVIIVLESFSKEYIGFFNGTSNYTNFLDSICQKSLVFDNSFANALHSNEGIPAIFSSIPALSAEPFLTSKYKANAINGIPKLLKSSGYTSAFFHGGVNGVYGFDYFAKKCGFERYYGKDEYGNNRHYDGSWGIWDDMFFKFTSENISKMNEPFIVGLFSLSSHHPYLLPPHYSPVLGNNKSFENSIMYTDYSLKSFFKHSLNKKWFKNTIFVITADHTARVGNPKNINDIILNRYSIPIIFYTPNGDIKPEISNYPVQQIDILPSIIDYLNVDLKFPCIGSSVFSKVPGKVVVNFSDGIYWAANNGTMVSVPNDQIGMDSGTSGVEYFYYSYGKHIRQQVGSNNKSFIDSTVTYLKSVVQYYNNSMNNNSLTKLTN